MSFTHERARVAALTRHHPNDPELAAASRRLLKAMRAERFIRSLLSESPTLTIEQRASLARQLLAAGGGDVNAA